MHKIQSLFNKKENVQHHSCVVYHAISPLKYGGLFSKRSFSWEGKILGGKFIRGLFGIEEIMIRSCQGGGEGSFRNTFSNNLNIS